MSTGSISDGYHTFDELYDHRCLLWINLCLLKPEHCYTKLEHYKGWFLLGMYKTEGSQISYHCPNKYLKFVEEKIDEDQSVEWDGHTPKGCLSRLVNEMAK